MDENGGPLIGVTVKCTDKGVSGVVTDLDGKFRVKDIPNNAHWSLLTLVIRSLLIK